ncbi:hypothetical protein COT97_01485 [Candidatus Falkowbacteria bacterium CG10_big_fil_rev_8_21_14_0_10_39_11]|uniref:Uncharacterized protein n=1 Tax=Candidatus Falkowbacteria bacterium CG10_big_fil_rev_8_21_14_0_10_39_11 TaxID=1974565 RepID=A0A2H0V7N2_9BACT|nr:MAG: hypothetical protein COT97_01485 [Candidatus Falkowbacteria bacterium CG10_big_fil_rev_8_21_14_0_10_39_11]
MKFGFEGPRSGFNKDDVSDSERISRGILGDDEFERQRDMARDVEGGTERQEEKITRKMERPSKNDVADDSEEE